MDAKKRFVAVFRSVSVAGQSSELPQPVYLAKPGGFVFNIQDAAVFVDPEAAVAAGNDALGALLTASPAVPAAAEVFKGWVLA